MSDREIVIVGGTSSTRSRPPSPTAARHYDRAKALVRKVRSQLSEMSSHEISRLSRSVELAVGEYRARNELPIEKRVTVWSPIPLALDPDLNAEVRQVEADGRVADDEVTVLIERGFEMDDRGTLDLGIVRDPGDSKARNDYQAFYETWEGLL